ncbi:MAG: hypothetical protein NVS4B3_08900 [Gemmatimonadaceae bacterium]
MPRRSAARSLVLATLVYFGFATRAQPQWTLTPFVGRDDAVASSPYLAGLAGSVVHDAVGVRLSVATGAPFGGPRPASLAAPTPARMVGSADADLLLDVPLLSVMGLAPSVFAGAGVLGRREADDRVISLATWSAGATAHVALANALSLETEARYRMPLVDSASVPRGFSRGWEYRVGIAFHFGRRGGWYASASTGSKRSPRAGRGDEIARATVRPSAVLATADQYVGAPYEFGGTNPDGFDCSGFVQYVYARHGIRLPRTSRQMARAGGAVEPILSALSPGDLILFAGNGRRIDHVALYTGDDRIIHSSASGAGVRYDHLRSRRGEWFVRHLVAARRVLGVPAAASGVENMFELRREALDPPDRAPPQ